MPFGPTDVLWIGAVPAIAAAVAIWVCLRLRLRPNAAWSLSIACGLVVGMVAQNRRDGWPVALHRLLHPRVAIDWLPWLVLIAAVIQILAAYAPRTFQRYFAAIACVFAIALPLRLLAGSVYVTARWSTPEKLGVLVIWSILFALWWLTLSLGQHNRLPLVRSVLLVITTFGIALTITASGAITLGELGGVAAASLFGATATAGTLRQLADGTSSAAGPLAVMLGSLIFLGYFYAQLTATNAALLSLSLAAAAGWLPTTWPQKPVWQAALRAVLTLVPLAIAAASAVGAVLAALADPYG
jgi:hypothetical protein